MIAEPASDKDFRYLGFTDRQIALLDGVDDEMRAIVYQEGLRLLMESGPGYGENPNGNLNI